jgi:endonuclease/exonuclease/phosphatase family metal-dependent hydrolase
MRLKKGVQMPTAIELKISDHNLLHANGIFSFNIAGAPYRGTETSSNTTNNGFNFDETKNPTKHTDRLRDIAQHIGQNITANSLGIGLLQEVPKNTDSAYNHFCTELAKNLPQGWVADANMHTWTSSENFANQIIYDTNRLQTIKYPKDFYNSNFAAYLKNELGEQEGRVQFAAFLDKHTGETIVVANVHAKWLSFGEMVSKQKIINTAQAILAQSFPNSKLLIGGDFNVDNQSLQGYAAPTEVALTQGARNVSYDVRAKQQKYQSVDLIIHSKGLQLGRQVVPQQQQMQYAQYPQQNNAYGQPSPALYPSSPGNFYPSSSGYTQAASQHAVQQYSQGTSYISSSSSSVASQASKSHAASLPQPKSKFTDEAAKLPTAIKIVPTVSKANISLVQVHFKTRGDADKVADYVSENHNIKAANGGNRRVDKLDKEISKEKHSSYYFSLNKTELAEVQAAGVGLPVAISAEKHKKGATELTHLHYRTQVEADQVSAALFANGVTAYNNPALSKKVEPDKSNNSFYVTLNEQELKIAEKLGATGKSRGK